LHECGFYFTMQRAVLAENRMSMFGEFVVMMVSCGVSGGEDGEAQQQEQKPVLPAEAYSLFGKPLYPLELPADEKARLDSNLTRAQEEFQKARMIRSASSRLDAGWLICGVTKKPSPFIPKASRCITLSPPRASLPRDSAV
jgi:hypothetical protein